jgi:hypothetical protein
MDCFLFISIRNYQTIVHGLNAQKAAQAFAEYIAQLPEWESDFIKGHREVE